MYYQVSLSHTGRQHGILLNVKADDSQSAVDGVLRYAAEHRVASGAEDVSVRHFGTRKPAFGVILDAQGKEVWE